MIDEITTIRLIIILAIHLILLSSCTEEGVSPAEDRAEDRVEYWGCWTEATGRQGVYDILLSPGNVTIGNNCGADLVASFDDGFFRQDTLILNTGGYEFWFYVQKDTLQYSVNAEGSWVTLEKFVKI